MTAVRALLEGLDTWYKSFWFLDFAIFQQRLAKIIYTQKYVRIVCVCAGTAVDHSNCFAIIKLS